MSFSHFARTCSGLHAQAVALTLLLCTSSVVADQELLLDDFNGPALDTAIWGLANWNIGDRTQFGNQPTFGNETVDGEHISFIRLPLDTFNPQAPGQRVLGTEIYSLQNFEQAAEGIEFLARARLVESQRGLVAAFFTYNQRRSKGRWLSDEIDFEVLSNEPGKLLMTSWDDWGAPGSDYDDGAHHLGALLTPEPGYNWSAWNDYAMRWYPDRVEWWVNGERVPFQQSFPVPDMPQPARASLWAAGTTWPQAYDPSLAPVSSSGANRTFHWDVDYILVSRLGGGSGGAPQPPSALNATVNGNIVSLNWTDLLNSSASYRVYRAWKPKGKASADFDEIAAISAGIFSYQDQAPDGEHLYRVTAVLQGVESAPSPTAAVTVGSGGKGKPGR